MERSAITPKRVVWSCAWPSKADPSWRTLLMLSKSSLVASWSDAQRTLQGELLLMSVVAEAESAALAGCGVELDSYKAVQNVVPQST